MSRRLRETLDYEDIKKLMYQKDIFHGDVREVEKAYDNVLGIALSELSDEIENIIKHLSKFDNYDNYDNVEIRKVAEQIRDVRIRAEKVIDRCELNIHEYTDEIKNKLKKFDSLYKRMF